VVLDKQLDETDGEIPPPIVWIHDYHLMLAANTIRSMCEEEGLEIRMGFFLHIPFPSFDIIRIFPWVSFFCVFFVCCLCFLLFVYCLLFIVYCVLCIV
jgi:trehalose 6-phosphate synthase/phosphatase